MNLILFSVVALIAVLNIKASLVLVGSYFYDRKQKLFQMVIIWLIPVLGAVLVLALAKVPSGERLTTDFSDREGSADGYIRSGSAATDEGEAGGSD